MAFDRHLRHSAPLHGDRGSVSRLACDTNTPVRHRRQFANNAEAKTVKVVATPAKGSPITFEARVRIDTPKERDYYRHGGILQYVLRQLAAKAA